MTGAAESSLRVPAQRPCAQTYFPALTGLRFVLAFWVVLHHLIGKGMMLEEWARSMPPFVERMLDGGYLAVQTFFILSGFVLAQTYASTRWNRATLARFGVARLARIYPVYLLSLVVVSRFAVETLARPGRAPLHKVALLGDYGFLLLGWLPPLGVGWNTPAWSLSCELFFYLCFPLIFLYLRNAGRSRIFTILAVTFIVPLLLARAGVPAVWKPLYQLSDFTAGIAAAGLLKLLNDSGLRIRRRGYWLYLPALTLGAALVAYPRILHGTFMDLGTALRPLNVALLLGLAIEGGVIAHVFSTKPIEYLGKASYSMYILHVPLIWWYSRYALHKLGPAPHLATCAAFLAGVMIVSIAAFELVEIPANRWLRSRFAAPHLERLREPRPAYAFGADFRPVNS